MKKKTIIIIILAVLLFGTAVFVLWKLQAIQNTFFSLEQKKQISQMIETRRQQALAGNETDPFGSDNSVKILLIGLDNRLGQTNGHCDAIQMIEIDKNKQTIKITAVPRGTYSPLPGKGHLPTDYYVSKACEVGGLDYGVKQIEKILGQKADYLVFVGFSEAIGIFRQLKLPANETMQWLRHRQGYAIGEPQRARNHSTFIKQMLIKYAPQIDTEYSLPVKYLIYKLIQSDLSFQQGLDIAEAISKMDLPNNPEKISLAMRPAYTVADIAYDPTQITSQLDALLKPIAKNIPEGAYTGITKEEAQQRIIDSINNGLKDADFVHWAYSNYLWLQIDDETAREQAHYDLLTAYVNSLSDQNNKNQVIADYIIEMEDLGKDEWADKTKNLLKPVNNNTFK